MLEIHSLDGYYDKSHVLHDVSLSVDGDETVALLGRNGAGKTSTIRSIMGVEIRTEARITFQGEQIEGFPPDERCRLGIGWVPERRRVFPNLSVMDNLRMGEQRKHDPKTSEAYELVFDLFPRLEERTNQKAGTMSGGEQQMLSIGRALISEPDLLLVDEPLEGLMPTLVSDIADILRSLKERDITMLIAEQRTQLTLEITDTAYIIENGEIVYEGASEALAADRELQERHLGVVQKGAGD